MHFLIGNWHSVEGQNFASYDDGFVQTLLGFGLTEVNIEGGKLVLTDFKILSGQNLFIPHYLQF